MEFMRFASSICCGDIQVKRSAVTGAPANIAGKARKELVMLSLSTGQSCGVMCRCLDVDRSSGLRRDVVSLMATVTDPCWQADGRKRDDTTGGFLMVDHHSP